MYKSLLIILFTFSLISAESQIINNSLDLSVGYGTGKFTGNTTSDESGFIAPSFYSNFKNESVIGLKVLFLKKNYVSIGLSAGYYSASGWQSEVYTDYKDAEAKLYEIAPVVQLHNKPAEYGFLNHTLFFIEASPAVGLSNVTIPSPLFDVENQSIPVALPTDDKSLFYGIKGGAGISYAVNQALGFFIESTGGYYLISPKLYTDNKFMNFNISVGLIARLRKDKRYYY